MTPVEAQLLFARAVLLILLYTFIGSVGVVAWLELRAGRRREAPGATSLPGARLIVLDGAQSDRPPGTAFALDVVNSLGRDLDNAVVLVDGTVSGRHAVLAVRDDAWWIEDLGSTNGSFVNGERVPDGAPAIVRSGDVIQVGAVRLRLVSPGP